MPYPYGNDLGKKPPKPDFSLNNIIDNELMSVYHPMKQNMEKLDALLKQQYLPAVYSPYYSNTTSPYSSNNTKSKKNLFDKPGHTTGLGYQPWTHEVLVKVKVEGLSGVDNTYYAKTEISNDALLYSNDPVAMAKQSVMETLDRIRKELFAAIDKEANK